MENPELSLNDLHDIVLPDAPGLWPFAPGLWAAIALVGLLLIAVGWQLWKRHQSNAYRRAGLQLLQKASSTYDVSVVLKRVALAIYPREEIAPLHGAQWAAFLNQQVTRRLFAENAFADSDVVPNSELKQLAAQWIRQHQRKPS